MTNPKQLGEEVINENPYEAFIRRCVDFDEKGCSKLQSSHGLARLLQRFHKEVIVPEYEESLQAHEQEVRREERERAVQKLDDIYDYGMGREKMIEAFSEALEKEAGSL